MSKVTTLKKIIILALILALPGFLYYLLTAEGKNRYKPLPIFGPKLVAKTFHKVKGKQIPDTVYHALSDFNLEDQNGKPVSFKTLDKKIFIVNFFYTHCPSICNEVNRNIDSLAANYAKNKMIYFVSITVDPARDSETVLKNYTNKLKLTTPNWLFLTGDTTITYNLARKGLLVDALQTGDDFVYSNKLILVDSQKRIRGYYSGTLMADVIRLNDEIKVLIAEELRRNDKPLY